MNESKVKETMKRCGARDEECSRLNGALSCLRKVTESGIDCLFCSVELVSQQPRSHPASFYVRQSTETFGSLRICCKQCQVVVLGWNCSDQTHLELWNGFVFDIMFSYGNKGTWKYPLRLNRNYDYSLCVQSWVWCSSCPPSFSILDLMIANRFPLGNPLPRYCQLGEKVQFCLVWCSSEAWVFFSSMLCKSRTFLWQPFITA